MFIQQLDHFDPSIKQHAYEAQSSSLRHYHLEIQYELCQLFLRKTGQQLSQKQTQNMQISNELLKSLSNKEMEKGISLSTDSGCESTTHQTQQKENIPYRTPSRQVQGGIWRKLDSKVGVWMLEIEENCSALCLANMKAIIGDYRKLLEKWWEIQARQSLIMRKNVHFLRQQQENIILKKQIRSHEITIDELKQRIQVLKQKNDSLMHYNNEKMKEMLGQQKIIQINEKVYRDIRNYLNDKQKNIIKRTQNIILLQKTHQERMLQVFGPDTCENCCGMLRKLKDSLMRFKKYLESEGAELEKMFSKYKKTLFSQRSYGKLH